MRRRAANEATVAEQERHLYLAGLYQGREDAIMGAPCREAALVGSDTALRRGYAQGFNGWTKALCTERQREPRGVAMTARTDRPTRLPMHLRANVTAEELLVIMSRLEGAESERDALREQVKTLREACDAYHKELETLKNYLSTELNAFNWLRARERAISAIQSHEMRQSLVLPLKETEATK